MSKTITETFTNDDLTTVIMEHNKDGKLLFYAEFISGAPSWEAMAKLLNGTLSND